MSAKNALCIGINDYPGTDSDLQGCVNDADDWGAALQDRGFTVESMLDSAATRDAMIDAMTKIVSGLSAGDVGVIQYSGHGTWQADDDGDEPDQRDEALCPYDVTTVGPLLDDDLFDILSQHDPQARLVFISDSCHSGSVTRSAAPLTSHAGRRRYLPPSLFLDPAGVARARVARRAPARGLSRGTALLMSGCADQRRCLVRRPRERSIQSRGSRHPGRTAVTGDLSGLARGDRPQATQSRLRTGAAIVR